MNAKLEEVSSSFLNRMIFLKFAILSAVVLSLTLGHPAATVAHKGAQKLCSFLMKNDPDCTRSC
ncbi:hypothetical protein [Geobacter sp.]|uniref:hypothetical protein n=1 Tax=Geobacter sp. TaxID=46610 RepID=UPI00263786B6|nr:hypothetical protein [Geobacter sp.]